jgi:NADPH-dependent ferric siderophore reductase
LGGDELRGLAVELPAASVRLLFPTPGTATLVVPRWTGNEFLLPDGHRPLIRTLTPRRVDAGSLEIDLEVVVHGHGAVSGWAAAAAPGDAAAISGPGRGYRIDEEAPSFLLAGDEAAIPAISQLLEALPLEALVEVHIEVAHPDARVGMPDHPGRGIRWHESDPAGPPGTALRAAVAGASLAPGMRVWVAGEAAAVQRIRHDLFDVRGLPRAHGWVRGYWKLGRTGEAPDTG